MQAQGSKEKKNMSQGTMHCRSLLSPSPIPLPQMTWEETRKVTWQACSHGTWDFSRRAARRNCTPVQSMEDVMEGELICPTTPHPPPPPSPTSHWSRLTQRKLTPIHFLVASSSSSAVPQDSRFHTCKAVFYSSPKMKGQPDEGGVPTDRKKAAAVMEI